jgi:hypothetical protein
MATECIEIEAFPLGTPVAEPKGESERKFLHLPASLKPQAPKSNWQNDLGTAIFLSEIEKRYNST